MLLITETFSWPRTTGRAQIGLFGAHEGVTAGPCAPPLLDAWRSAGTPTRSPPEHLRADSGSAASRALGRKAAGWPGDRRTVGGDVRATAVASVGGEPVAVAGDCPQAGSWAAFGPSFGVALVMTGPAARARKGVESSPC